MDVLRARDTYTDHMTRREMTALLRKGGSIEPELNRRIVELAQRSGAAGVSSGRVRRIPQGKDGLILKVEFDSSAWTGRSHLRPRLRRDFWSRLRVWLPVTLKKLLCDHRWNLVRNKCSLCGLTHEQSFDHSFSHFPRQVYF